MKSRAIFAVLGVFFLLVNAAFGGERPRLARDAVVLHGGSTAAGKASGDTIEVMGPEGSGAAYIGDFESGWNGWTSIDITQPTITHWQVSDYNQAVPGNLAAWCGDITIASCNDSLDVVGGYGNSWHDLLGYRATVADPDASANVTVSATLQHDTEPGYDYTRLSARIEGNQGFTDIQFWDGKGTVAVANGLTYMPGELVDGTDIYVLFRVQSDGGWSDADCSWPTAGACQVDDITVTVTQSGQTDIVSFTDFEDGTLGDWAVDFPFGVGDFAHLWTGLRDLDPCASNLSQQVAFIDDGIVVPGTGGSDCINWCYGPGGYIVTTTGGLAGPASKIRNDVWSPVMTWPNASHDGILLSFDAYRHEDLSADAPGIFYTWGIRSADTDGSAGAVQVLAEQGFLDRNFVYYGGPDYLRVVNDVTDLMNPGRDVIQIRLGVYQYNVWGWWAHDGYPAPYFDNASVKVFPYVGPGMVARELDMAQDNFPEVDAINFDDLGSMHVRFDMANNISLASHLRNDPGDSIVVDIVPVRTGAALAGAPEFHYTIDANPVFDAYRTTPTTGMIEGIVAVGASGVPDPDAWAFDLPDTGTLFPGDVLHYYIRAGDDVGGDIQWSTMPADLAGYGDFSDPQAYNSSFVVRALPTITYDGFGGYDVPNALFWNDFADRGGQDEWFGAFGNLNLLAGVDYDVYYTNAPSSGVGNGLGGRTTGLALEHYTDLIYSAGDLSVSTISNGDFSNDAGDDIGALLAWLSNGNKDLLLTGDNVASDLGINSGAAGLAFLETVMGVNVGTNDIRNFIDNQTTPLVLTVAGNPVFANVSQWLAYGGCRSINTFDGVTVRAGAARLAEFGDPNHNPGAYVYSAATLNYFNSTNRVVSLPYDLMYVYTDPDAKIAAPVAARVMVLSDVLDYFGVTPGFPVPSPVPESAVFAVSSYPNPFNPVTKISYTIKVAGPMSLKIYDVRGQLVRTLIDGEVRTDGHVMWDGTDDGGAAVASGVYFSSALMGADSQVGKMVLVK